MLQTTTLKRNLVPRFEKASSLVGFGISWATTLKRKTLGQYYSSVLDTSIPLSY